jgi:hypothetical protein
MNLFSIFPFWVAILFLSSTPGGAAILSPTQGQALQGSVPIVGNTSLEGFKSAELTFSYANDPTNTWFFIAYTEETTNAGKIADWDTTTLTDGNYTLRLTITKQDDSQAVVVVTGLRIRNYSPIETATPTPPRPSATSAPGDTPAPTATLLPSPTPIPLTSTPLPPNPVQLSPRDLGMSISQGILVVFMAFAVFGIILAVRRRSKN